jgi:hypothetical protein
VINGSGKAFALGLCSGSVLEHEIENLMVLKYCRQRSLSTRNPQEVVTGDMKTTRWKNDFAIAQVEVSSLNEINGLWNRLVML